MPRPGPRDTRVAWPAWGAPRFGASGGRATRGANVRAEASSAPTGLSDNAEAEADAENETETDAETETETETDAETETETEAEAETDAEAETETGAETDADDPSKRP